MPPPLSQKGYTMKIEIDLAKFLRRESRKVRLPRGGKHGTKKGAKGYTRKRKHKGRGDGSLIP